MTTLKQTRENMARDTANAMLHLMEFVDDFRRTLDLRALQEPFVLSDERLDALVAATAENCVWRLGCSRRNGWKPYRPAGIPGLFPASKA